MKVVITGKGGQLAWELEQLSPKGYEVISVGIDDLDITNESLVSDFIANTNPDLVINAAAYTAVDKAEEDTKTAYAVNELGTKYLANACKLINSRILHISTDFVFDGSKTTPYQTDAIPNPINVYGASKLAGDVALQEILPEASVIVRTAWVYSVNGNNFVKSMLRLMQDKPQLGIIYDQVGTPTWAKGLAQWLWAVAEKKEVTGIYHWTDAGVASWYDFAIAIQELGGEKGLLNETIPILPIPTSAYPTPAKRPAFSVIDKSSAESVSGLNTVHWRKQLSSMMDELL
ncbi:dTDP-4-dehydrorhamnose reductase [Vibrio aestuarianus]|uniref:dTDP-4-dehydrorhamnose reductase n=1 Tax=Vibrio aestuarianus TaxID=28171 RepID=A0A9X4EX89_9VIBR|nr:dTDP-4-dehydrorhamnose reductase [Vibrio aestuarianus]MDE1234356.1 dTDP-4-dehydrorhamnose reductase [Vibrio aestuarianus]MDE1243122.1 dTDP-4-dehydrorhamnose reductase [Vibrio aestuarianus]MDE1245198.1 dTDP-4-dehydrorhamnose reductase [Vibrio aestuarianus]MDE1313015.1 dTDP-4-dehydrorhamnose reductase [Vibrio aestuarianus]NGZ65257.1 dTDP-4-dehydrorhamnose reductase [Vibrio aestuarianus subsp. cardii]